MYDEAGGHVVATLPAHRIMPTWEEFTRLSNWRLLPTRTGSILMGVYDLWDSNRTEITLVRRMTDDTEAGKRALPANIPYEQVIETVVMGHVSDLRHITTGPRPYPSTATYTMGHSRYLTCMTFAMVTHVAPDALSMLVCKGIKRDWWHVDPKTGAVVSSADNLIDDYDAVEARLNQH